MRGSCASRDHRCNGSVRTSAGVRWSASGNANGTGSRPAPGDRPGGAARGNDAASYSRHIDPLAATGLHSTCPARKGTRVLRWVDENLLHLKWEEIGEHYGRYRLHVPEAERAKIGRASC